MILLLKENLGLISIADAFKYSKDEYRVIADLSLNIYMELITGNEKTFEMLFDELLIDAFNHISAHDKNIVSESTIGNFCNAFSISLIKHQVPMPS